MRKDSTSTPAPSPFPGSSSITAGGNRRSLSPSLFYPGVEERNKPDNGHDWSASMGTQRHYINDDISELGIRDANDIVVQFEPTHAVTGEAMNADQESLISIDSIRLISR
jgi:hypothetical protein